VVTIVREVRRASRRRPTTWSPGGHPPGVGSGSGGGVVDAGGGVVVVGGGVGLVGGVVGSLGGVLVAGGGLDRVGSAEGTAGGVVVDPEGKGFFVTVVVGDLVGSDAGGSGAGSGSTNALARPPEPTRKATVVMAASPC
jgi:hypothetical protein